MGCDTKCMEKEKKEGSCPSDVFAECCNDGVIRISYANVNTAAVIENNYGDVENLSFEEFQEVDQHLTNMYGQFVPQKQCRVIFG